MSTKSKFKSDAFEAIHSSVSGRYRAGTIDKATMRSFDVTCLSAPPQLKPEEIKILREKSQASQPLFARYLNTSESTVEKGETGAKRPSGMALELLVIVQKHGLDILTRAFLGSSAGSMNGDGLDLPPGPPHSPGVPRRSPSRG